MKFAPFAAAASLSLLLAACATPAPEPEPAPAGPAPSGTQAPADRGEQITPGSARDFEVNAGDRVFYGFDRYDVDNQARETLRRQAQWLQRYPETRIQVAGNADERGTREYNLALGSRRANSARDFLVSQGVDASRISVVSYGKERPSCTQSTEQCWAQNRNATTTVTSGAAS
ncbi:peptidoglycan-associated lipoprotein Pal [Glycocaulis profundi]|nr:peptidoglycan-associated lipoprotein Pal [Glycocaulis profundi]